LELEVVKGVSPCVDSGFSLEGQFSAGIDVNRVAQVLAVFGEPKLSEELGALRIKTDESVIILHSAGSLVVRGKTESAVERLAAQVERAVGRALFCQACGSCVPQCEHGALNLDVGRIAVNPEKCTNCLKCDQWPCPTYLT
jgi:phosphoadenosine phosphosulfate reductase